MDKYTFNQVQGTILDCLEVGELNQKKLVIVGKSGESFTTTTDSFMECDCACLDKDEENDVCVNVFDVENHCYHIITLTDIERIDIYCTE